SWMITGIRLRVVGRGEWLDYLGIAALLLTPATVMVQVLQSMKRIDPPSFGPVPLAAALWLLALLLYAVWIQVALWRSIRRLGGRGDVAVLSAVHVAMALGLAIGMWMLQQGYLTTILLMFGAFMPVNAELTWREGVAVGTRMGLTYMGYVVLLWVVWQFLG